MNWQPIKTAPKTRRILLWFPELFIGIGAIVGKWDRDEYSKNPRPFWTCDLERLGKNRVRECQPTHWCEIEKPTMESK